MRTMPDAQARATTATTVIELLASDRCGMLHDILQLLTSFGLSVGLGEVSVASELRWLGTAGVCGSRGGGCRWFSGVTAECA